MLGALMLLRAGVEGPSPSRVAGLMRAGRVILFMFAFAAVNRAQGEAAAITAVATATADAIRQIAAAIALEATLSFLGLGLPITERAYGPDALATNYALKVLWEALLTPVTYRVVSWFKAVEGLDVFDTGTDFTPFKTKV